MLLCSIRPCVSRGGRVDVNGEYSFDLSVISLLRAKCCHVLCTRLFAICSSVLGVTGLFPGSISKYAHHYRILNRALHISTNI